MSLGSELKDARESKKITLETVSQKTRIPVKYLEHIERGEFDVFPSQTYAKGFIRAYAKVVGVDPQVLTRQFNNEVSPVEMRIEPKNAEAELEKALGWRPTLNRPPVFRREEVPGDLNLELVDSEPEPSRHEPSVMRQRSLGLRKIKWGKWGQKAGAALGILVLAVGLVWMGRKVISRLHWHRAAVSNATSGAVGGAQIEVKDKYQHLILKGLDKSWILVTMDDGQTSSELDLDEGEVKIYQAVRNFKLKIGNAGGVDVQFNGKSLGMLGALGQVVEIELPGATSDNN